MSNVTSCCLPTAECGKGGGSVCDHDNETNGDLTPIFSRAALKRAQRGSVSIKDKFFVCPYMDWMLSVRLVSNVRNCLPFLVKPLTSAPAEQNRRSLAWPTGPPSSIRVYFIPGSVLNAYCKTNARISVTVGSAGRGQACSGREPWGGNGPLGISAACLGKVDMGSLLVVSVS